MIPNLKNKTALILIGISVLLIISGLILDYIIPENEYSDLLIIIGLSSGQLVGLIMMVRNGTLMNTTYWKFINFCIGITIVGALFKIQHWPGSNIILLAASIGITITYAIRFFIKTKKEHLDILKFTWVTTSYSSSVLVILHLISREFMTISYVIFWLTLIDFVVIKYSNKTLFNN